MTYAVIEVLQMLGSGLINNDEGRQLLGVDKELGRLNPESTEDEERN